MGGLLQDSLAKAMDPEGVRMKMSQLRLHIARYRGGIIWMILFWGMFLATVIGLVTKFPEAMKSWEVVSGAVLVAAIAIPTTVLTLKHMHTLDKAAELYAEDIAASFAQILIVINRHRGDLRKVVKEELRDEQQHTYCLSQHEGIMGHIWKEADKRFELYGNERQRAEIDRQNKAS